MTSAVAIAVSVSTAHAAVAIAVSGNTSSGGQVPGPGSGPAGLPQPVLVRRTIINKHVKVKHVHHHYGGPAKAGTGYWGLSWGGQLCLNCGGRLRCILETHLLSPAPPHAAKAAADHKNKDTSEKARATFRGVGVCLGMDDVLGSSKGGWAARKRVRSLLPPPGNLRRLPSDPGRARSRR